MLRGLLWLCFSLPLLEGFLIGPDQSSCPMYGCSARRTFSQANFEIPFNSEFSEIWSYDFDKTDQTGCVSGGTSLVCRDVVNNVSSVVALEPVTGELLWRREFSKTDVSYPVIDHTANVVAVTMSKLSVIDSESGEIKFESEYSTTPELNLSRPALLWNGTAIVYTSKQSGNFFLASSSSDGDYGIVTSTVTQEGKKGVWKLLNELAIIESNDKAVSYFFAYNGDESSVRFYALTFELSPPLIKPKWFRELGHSDQFPVSSFIRQPTLVINSGIITISTADGNTMMLIDTGTGAEIAGNYPFVFESSHLFSFEAPIPGDAGTPAYGDWIWMTTRDSQNLTSVLAWDSIYGYPLRIYDLWTQLNVDAVAPVTDVTITGRKFENQTMVMVLKTYKQGVHSAELVAMQPDNESVHLLIKANITIPLQPDNVRFEDQIVGVKDNILIVTSTNDKNSRYTAYKISPK